MNHLTSLRDYLDALAKLDDLRVIDEEVDVELEIGAIARYATENRAPAHLLDRIRGHEPGFRVLTAPAALSSDPAYPYARAALSLGLDPQTPPLRLMDGLVAAQAAEPVPPVVVPTGPCQENVLLGDDADLTRFPFPLLHQGDGGRYVNTVGTFVLRSPDGKWTNWGIARTMLHDAHRMATFTGSPQHIGVIDDMWRERGEPTPFALVLGAEPAVPFVSAMSLPEHVDEAAYLGAYFGHPLEVVRCKTVDLEVPATAEIVIEGYIDHDDLIPEGPMGEFAGYVPEPHQWNLPAYRVTAITHRNDPIMPVVCAGKPVDEDHTLIGLTHSARWTHHLREKGIPVTAAWMIPESAVHVLAVTVDRDWREKTGFGSSEELSRAVGEAVTGFPHGGWWVTRIMVLDNDIDPTDLRDVLWGWATRSHPSDGSLVLQDTAIMHIMACYTDEERATGTGPTVVYDCIRDLRKLHSTAFADNYPAEVQRRSLDLIAGARRAEGMIG
ncbi:UbiD family decarboxylase [Streptomyces morookaense]|uniref:Pyrrole-2-carboxylic acid decarboxylase n=1 Tax=Streptomyces morookaense TaxID=1970 RepID=A0A7Y7B108_STRMO|nr:UbiD family decarboxylase [Streptomyces morookaense]NVK77068.1 UbiD family decarboxylase [Streptomyces morookaense]GHF23751.1 UbiD-like decarboxylase [Streptomyces morookaense]